MRCSTRDWSEASRWVFRGQQPRCGSEAFVHSVHDVIETAGPGTLYVFDCLSHLAATWGSDQSLGNFFQLTCPRLLDLETVTYFGIYRDRHSAYAIEPIRGTTQFMLDVFRLEGRLYIRPVKIQYRSRDVAYFPKKTGNSINDEWFRKAPNRLLELESSAASLAEVVRVIDCSDAEQRVWLRADTTEQEALVFLRP